MPRSVDSPDKSVGKLDIEVLTALRLAAYQLLFLDRIPGRAAVHESVELVKRARKGSAAPFANAVLRKLAESRYCGWIARSALAPDQLRNDAADSKAAAALSQKLAHPLWLVERWVRQFGLERARQICIYDQHAPAAAIRFSDPGTEAELETRRDRSCSRPVIGFGAPGSSWKCFPHSGLR